MHAKNARIITLMLTLSASNAFAQAFDGFLSPEERNRVQMERLERQQQKILRQQQEMREQQSNSYGGINFDSVRTPNGRYDCVTVPYGRGFASTNCR